MFFKMNCSYANWLCNSKILLGEGFPKKNSVLLKTFPADFTGDISM